MAEYITKRQFQEIAESAYYGKDEFHRVLEKYTGIKARPYTAYLYYDNCDNFLGDSGEATLEHLLSAAYVEVKDE